MKTIARTLCTFVTFASALAAQRRPSLEPAAISDIATLLLLEDVRRFDSLELVRFIESPDPEVRECVPEWRT